MVHQEPLPHQFQPSSPQVKSSATHTDPQHGRDGDERDEALRHQQPEPGRRGEAEVAAAPGPPGVWKPHPAGDHHRGHPLHQAAPEQTWLLISRFLISSPDKSLLLLVN